VRIGVRDGLAVEKAVGYGPDVYGPDVYVDGGFAGVIATSIIATLIMAGGATALRMGTQDSPGMAVSPGRPSWSGPPSGPDRYH